MTARPHLRQRRCPRLRPVARAQRGVYAIEFAFTFLLLFGLIYTIICYGILLTYRMALQNAAEEGARAALRYQPDITARLAEAGVISIQIHQHRNGQAANSYHIVWREAPPEIDDD